MSQARTYPSLEPYPRGSPKTWLAYPFSGLPTCLPVCLPPDTSLLPPPSVPPSLSRPPSPRLSLASDQPEGIL